MTSKEIRRKYLEFFKLKGHKIIPSASLIPENDSSTLFIGSGMQPLLPYLLGEKHPEGNCLVNSQKSFRAEDIEEVGDNRHNTFFEMLGNWSLGDYFKEKQLEWIWEFLIKEVKLDPSRIYTTVFRGNNKIGIGKDIKSVEIWKKLFAKSNIKADDIDFSEKNGTRNGRIFYYDESKNWWSRSGIPSKMPVNELGGPDSEIFYDLGAGLKRHENSVFKDLPCHVNCDCGRFIEIGNSVFMEYVKTKNGFEKLKQKNVDFGGGLERITMVSQGKDNIFETDLFVNVLNKIKKLSGGKEYKENMKAFEIIADHIKGAVFIIGDDKGISPSNTGQGYVVRRLIRRAIRYGNIIGIVNTEDGWLKDIAKIIIHDYCEIYPELSKNSEFIISQIKDEEKKFAKTLKQGLKEFEKMFENYKGNFKEFTLKADILFNLYQTYGFPIELSFEEIDRIRLKNKGLIVKDGIKKHFLHLFNDELKKHQELSRTASAGKFKGGLADAGEETKKLHTAAHLLLESLRRILGKAVYQKGSNITAERLRFDFSYPKKMTDEQKSQIEEMVNEQIEKKLPVDCEEMSLDEAKKIGAMGVFESKYGEKVKVYTIGKADDVFSREICGGPHAKNTSELGKFKIKKEQSSSAGVRRIKAILE